MWNMGLRETSLAKHLPRRLQKAGRVFSIHVTQNNGIWAGRTALSWLSTLVSIIKQSLNLQWPTLRLQGVEVLSFAKDWSSFLFLFLQRGERFILALSTRGNLCLLRWSWCVKSFLLSGSKQNHVLKRMQSMEFITANLLTLSPSLQYTYILSLTGVLFKKDLTKSPLIFGSACAVFTEEGSWEPCPGSSWTKVINNSTWVGDCWGL